MKLIISCICLLMFVFAHDGHDHSHLINIKEKKSKDKKSKDKKPKKKKPKNFHPKVELPRSEETIKYEFVANWFKLPNGDDFGSTHGGVVVDKDGFVYVATLGKYNLAVFDKDGNYVKSLGEKYKVIHGLMINTEGDKQYLYATGTNQVFKISLDGETVLTLSNDQQVKWSKTTSIAVDSKGNIYLADGYKSNIIFKYDKEGKFINKFGVKGKKEGQFRTSHGLIIDNRNGEEVLVVADRENRRLQIFSLEGKFIKIAAEHMRRPAAMAIWKDYLAVAELQGRVTVFDKDFKVVAYIGDNPNLDHWALYRLSKEEWKDGILNAPHGLGYDENGNLYVMDWNITGRVSKFTLEQ